ncbi:MAG: hypothetical protein AAF611_13815 [Bacteroidota bacterium]
MKKKRIENLKLKKNTVSKINELNKTVGGEDSFQPEGCFEEFTWGCSPSFLQQCTRPPVSVTECTQPPFCP